MISETTSRKNQPALQSDRWHVVHARLSRTVVNANRSRSHAGEPLFERFIVSEHDDRTGAARAAEEIAVQLEEEMAGRAPESRDQIFVRKPGYKTLKTAPRVTPPGK